MTVSREDVEYTAGLAKLALTADEASEMVDELGQILAHFGQLSALDTAGVPATSHPLEEKHMLRKDESGVSYTQEQALQNAPQADGENFIVPRVL